MRVCLVIPSFYPAFNYGGPIISSYNTSKCLAARPELEIFVSTTNTNLTASLDVEVNTFHEIYPSFYVKYYHENIREVFSSQLLVGIWRDIYLSDIIHIQAIFNYTTVVSLIVARLCNKKTILTPRGCLGLWAMQHKNIIKRVWCSFFIRPFSKYVRWHATSEQEKSEILQHFPKAKVSIIPNGVDTQEYDNPCQYNGADLLTKFGLQPDPLASKIVVSVGRLHTKKGFDILIKSFSHVLQKFPRSHLLIAGPDGGEKTSLLKLISKLSLEKNVHLLGEIYGDDKISLYASADVFALPSHNENYGNVYIESLAAGTPIIASVNTPWSDIGVFGCGLWVENTVDRFTESIMDILLRDKEEMYVICRTYASSKDWHCVAGKFDELFSELNFQG